MNGVEPRVYLDANVFIAAFEVRSARSDHAWWLLNAIEDKKITGVTSEITLAELLVKPLRLDDQALAKGYEAMLVSQSGFDVVPVRRDVLIKAAELRATRTSIKLPDAIHLATARTMSCTAIVSDDHRLPAVEGMTVLSINPFTLDDIQAAET